MSKLQRNAALSSSLVAVTLFFSAAGVASAATDTWSSSPSSANWNTANWTGGNNPPVAGDALVFGSSSITTLNNNFTAGAAFDGIYFTGGNSFTLNGSSVLISGAASNIVGVMNNSGGSQTLGTAADTRLGLLHLQFVRHARAQWRGHGKPRRHRQLRRQRDVNRHDCGFNRVDFGPRRRGPDIRRRELRPIYRIGYDQWRHDRDFVLIWERGFGSGSHRDIYCSQRAEH